MKVLRFVRYLFGVVFISLCFSYFKEGDIAGGVIAIVEQLEHLLSWHTLIEHLTEEIYRVKSTHILLFDGNSYEKYGDTGYYQGGKWKLQK